MRRTAGLPAAKSPTGGLTPSACRCTTISESNDCGPNRPCYTPVMPALREVPDEPPPFLGTWRRVYIGVLLYLAAIILLCYVFSAVYAFARALP
jgi:hypothetical protein